MTISIEELELLQDMGVSEEDIIAFDKEWENARNIMKIIFGE